MAKTLKVTKGNVNILVRRGVVPASIAKKVQGGSTVSIQYEGNRFTSFRPTGFTIDGQSTSAGRGFEPERQRRSMTPRRSEGVPSKVTKGTPSKPLYPDVGGKSDLPEPPKPSYEREQFISTREGGGAAIMSQADIQEFTKPRVAPQLRGGLAARDGITAGEIFAQAKSKGLTVEEYVGTGPVYREGVPVGGRGVGFAPSPERITTARRDIERDLGAYNKQISTPSKQQPKLTFWERGRAGASLAKDVSVKKLGAGVSDATLGWVTSAVKGGLQISYIPTELGQRVQEKFYPKLTAKAKSFDKLIGFNREKLRKDLQPKAKDVMNFALGAGFVGGGAVLPGIVSRASAVGLGTVGTIYGISEAKAGREREAAKGLTIGALGLTEAPGLIRTIGMRGVARVGEVLGFAKEIPTAKKFDITVLKGESTFPSTPGPKQALKEFRRTRDVSHTTANKFSADVIGPGNRLREAASGLFVTPKGRASPYFTRVGGRGGLDISLFPSTPRPAIIDIGGVKSFKRIPKSVLLQGREAVISYTSQRAGQGIVFITAGSEARASSAISKALGIKGTSEIEGLIPAGSRLKSSAKGIWDRVVGFKEFIRYEGEIIPIKEFKLDIGGVKGKGGIKVGDITKEISVSRRDLARIGRRELPISRSLVYGYRPVSTTRPVSRIPQRPRARTPTSRISRVFERPRARPTTRPRETPRIRETTRDITRRVFERPRARTTPRPTTRPTSRTTTRTTRGYRSVFTARPPPPPTTKITFDFKGILGGESKKPRELARVFKYKPTLISIEKNIKGKAPEILTGLEVRPL